ncbi:MAG: TIGR03943 family protein [Spirochaetaceae bacterium]|nr:MAG: TIGR03943 family protein [Spirochaetaceae bacterium]
MKGNTRSVLGALLYLAAFTVLWGVLVFIGMPGRFPGLLHPRIWSRALASSIVLVILGAWYLISSLRGDREACRPITVIPLFLLLLLVPPALRDPQVDRRHLNITAGGNLPGINRESSDLLSAVDAVLREQSTDPDHAEELGRLLEQPDPIIIADADYSRTIDLIWDAPQRFAGRTVETVAFVFRRPDWSPEIFTAARLSIWCCVADAAVIGLLVETSLLDAPRENDWVRIRGELAVMDSFDTGSVTMRNAPVLRNVTWESAAAPDFEYVFPANW